MMARLFGVMALAATLSACGPAAMPMHGGTRDKDPLPTSAGGCGSENPNCAPGGRPRWVIRPDGNGGFTGGPQMPGDPGQVKG